MLICSVQILCSLSVDDVNASRVSSFQLGNLSTSWCSLICKPGSINTTNKYSLLHKVTQSWPSPALCFVEPQDEENLHITAFNSGDGSSNSDNKSASSKTIRDVHIVRTTTACLNIKIVYFRNLWRCWTLLLYN